MGDIEGHEATVGHAPGLDVLGIGVVLAASDEPVAPSLEEVARVPVTSAEVRVLRNPESVARRGLRRSRWCWRSPCPTSTTAGSRDCSATTFRVSLTPHMTRA